MLYASDVVLVSETTEGLRNRFRKFVKRHNYKVNLGIIKLMIRRSIVRDGLFVSTVCPCGVCTLRVKTDTVLCVKCGK